MKKRRALLIGVPEYESDAIEDLPIVRRDIENLHVALEKSDFAICSLGTDGISHTGRSKLLQALRQECKEAKGVDTLLLYFSGHGMHYKSQDYLIPSDAALDDAEYVEEYLVSTDIGHIIDQSGAKTIIFFIDACREGVKLGFKNTYLAGWSKGEREHSQKRSFVMVFACGPGQVSQYVKGEDGFSLFSKALAEVLDTQHFACTLKEVLDETQARLNILIAENKKQPQKIFYSFESAVDDDILSNVICDSVTAASAKGKINDPWSEAALQSPLWNNKGTEANSIVIHLKQQVAKILAACWQEWQAAINSFPQDPWRDEALPIRVLEALDLLVFRSDPQIELTDAETALVITVPFVREAVLAGGLVQLAKANPLSLEVNKPETDLRSVIDRIHQSSSRLVRKAKRLQVQGRTADKDAVMTWLLHRSLLKTLEFWIQQSDGGKLSSNLLKSLENVAQCSSRLSKETLTTKLLLELARCLFADVERIDRDDRPEALQPRLVVGAYSEEQQIREKMVAYLLKLAGLLAIDIHTLSDILIDHIGLSDPLTPNDVRSTIAQARWNPSGRGRTLRVTCHHPAVDLVLREHVEQANLILDHIFRQLEEKRVEMEVLVGLPIHFSPDGINAEKQNGVAVYQTPHINFQLAHDEVRELLMGEQLYGDPRLAIRELYQNALDACRYREARLTYLNQTGKYQGQDKTWEGRIIFRQAKDDKGREYIECEDNGIGMGKQHLSQCFARAGKRFADLPEFIEEQAEWLKCDPQIRLYPNSQFGVGVLSYFMLADELEVDTCRLDRKGIPGQKLHIRIPGSSGLFRVQKLNSGKDDSSGTRVRLYLNRIEYEDEPISCLKTLKELLWIAEFRTEVHELNEKEIWQPGELRHPTLSNNQFFKTDYPDVWWINHEENRGKGSVLSDGVFTENKSKLLVINLRKEHLPKLTINRQQIVDLDLSWLNKKLLNQGWQSLLNWQHLTVQWLWRLELAYPDIATKLFKSLCQKQVSVELKGETNGPHKLYSSFSETYIGWTFQTINIPVFKVGLSIIDGAITYFVLDNFKENKLELDDIKQLSNIAPLWIVLHRIFILSKYGLEIPFLFKETIKFYQSSDQLTILYPGDTFLLNFYKYRKENFRYEPKQHKDALDILLLGAYILNESVALILERLERLCPLLGSGLLNLKRIVSINKEAVKNLIIDQNDLHLLSQNLDGEGPWLEETIPLIHLLAAAVKFERPVTEIFKQLEKFVPLGFQLPQVNLKDIENLIINQDDLYLLSRERYTRNNWLKETIPLIHLLSAAVKFERPVTEIFKQLEKFIPLGLQLPQFYLEDVENLIINQDDLYLLSHNLDGRSPWLEKTMPLGHLLVAAVKFERPITEIFKQLERFIPLGFQLPQVNLKDIENLIINQDDLRFLSHNLDGRSPWLEKTIPLIHLLVAAVKFEQPVAEIFKQLEKFIPLGFQLPQINLQHADNLIINQDDLRLFFHILNSEDYWLKDNVTSQHLLLAAKKLNRTVANVWKQLEKFIPLGLNLPEINLESVENFIPTDNDLKLLSQDFYEISPDWFNKEISTVHLLIASAELGISVYDILQRLLILTSLLNLQIPSVNLELVKDLTVSFKDVLILSQNLDAAKPWIKDNFSLMHIIQFSARLNEPLCETLRDLRKFQAVGLSLPEINVEILGNFTPTLNDLIAISKDLDGLEPWIEGIIDPDHIVRVSNRLGNSVENTLQRLCYFSPILGLILPKEI